VLARPDWRGFFDSLCVPGMARAGDHRMSLKRCLKFDGEGMSLAYVPKTPQLHSGSHDNWG
jgi:hypothetical protein